ncbi:MAG: LamB/YcsF family protein [Stackebrandtia sp.]
MTGRDVLIDLNSDLGEGFGVWRSGDDDALLDLATSVNVACGFHAGDPRTMRTVCERAVSRGVAVGAHVGYRDLAGFGRRHIDVDPVELSDEIVYQIAALDAFARIAGDRVRYVKPHGALYNAATVDRGQAEALVDAVRRYDPALPVLCLPDSLLLRLARAAGLRVVAEAFADRAYTADGRLVPRRTPGAVLHDVDAVARRCLRLAVDGEVESVDGPTVSVRAQSICVHGDTPQAVDIAREVRRRLIENGARLAPFA